MRSLSTALYLSLSSALIGACQTGPEPAQPAPETPPAEVHYAATEGHQLGLAARVPQKPQDLPAIELERVSAHVPWPRGIAWVDGKLAVVARGRHRSYGGPAPDVQDQEATIFEVDPEIREPYVQGRLPSARVLANGRVLAEPDPAVVGLYDRARAPLDNWHMNRPFCTMVYDEASRNLIFCAYSGVDLSGAGGGPSFRKNATDALFRFDLRSRRWGVVEQHDPAGVPREAQGEWIANDYYPHHDPAANPPPHGLLNGPNGCAVAGRWLYAVGKDNHTLARYDLTEIRRDPSSGAPRAEAVLGELIDVKVDGALRTIPVRGHSAVAAHGGWLYLASRTSSMVLRFPITSEGDLVEPVVGELIAEFEPYSTETKRSADLWEMIASDAGEIFVSTSRQGRVWRFRPDPAVPFDGNDKRALNPTENRPYVDIKALTGNPRAAISNMTFAPDGSLYFCMTMPEEGRELAGDVMRVRELARGEG